MSMFHNIMNKLGRYRLIPDRRTGSDYMHRYYIFLKDRKWFPFNVTLHKIVRSDDPIMHDHPWGFMTIILRGGYYEHTPCINPFTKEIVGENKVWRGPGSIIIRTASDYHWLELDDNKPTTTLFCMGQQKRDWGFVLNNKWIHHETYLKNAKIN